MQQQTPQPHARLVATSFDAWMCALAGVVLGSGITTLIIFANYHAWFCANVLGYWVCR